MIFVKQERLLRISSVTLLAVHIYIQECNVDWFADTIFQEVLQAIRPELPSKVAECRQGIKQPSQYKNSAIQLVYYIDKAESPGQVLLQEPRVKDEDEDEETHQNGDGVTGSDAQSLSKGLFTYKALRPAKSVLVMVPEPFDANNDVVVPNILGVEIK
ncbi:hypothetical protein EV174_002187 [Coemansia sp. RSA 2320]|nr:hypothetical protein EV174_002187 [Coemansia sp. RSA 2320]